MMPSIQAHTDGGEDVNDFLQRIREQNDTRDQEDDARTRKLEEEVLQARKERQARRAGTCSENAPRVWPVDGMDDLLALEL
jgi:hypothetical protein